MRTTSLTFSIATPLLLLGVFVLAFYPQPADAVNQCTGGDRMVTNGVCRSTIYDDGERCPGNKPSTSCFGFEVAPGGGGVPVDVGSDAAIQAELSPAGPTKVAAVPALDASSKDRRMRDGGGQTRDGGTAPNTPDTLDASQRGVEKSDIRRGMKYGETAHRKAKFKAGKALADTVKRNGNAGQAGDEGSGQLNREKYKKLKGVTSPPPPHLPEDDPCDPISSCIP